MLGQHTHHIPHFAVAEMESADLADSEIESEREDAGTDIPRQRGRYIPVAIRRAVRQRDEYRCTFVSEEGRRCCEVSRLEFHHVKPFALLRKHTVEGITLRCVRTTRLRRKKTLAARRS